MFLNNSEFKLTAMVKILITPSTVSLILVSPGTNCTFPFKSFV